MLAAFAFAGCEAPVRRTLPTGIHSLAIKDFSNMTDQPMLSALLLEELRREFRLDGRFSVVDTQEGADALLDGTVTDYMRQPARFDANNVVQEYRLHLAVDLSFKDLKGSTTLWEGKGSASTAAGGGATGRLERYTNYIIVPASGVPAETEQDAQRRMVRELARDAVIRIIEGR